MISAKSDNSIYRFRANIPIVNPNPYPNPKEWKFYP